ncbi:MAG: oligosaccharide flippase family protein, partial [Cyclobacteriaceae bacterium]
MSNEKKAYQQVFKATSLFGGVQVFTILIKIIRSKFIAILLGPEGMGIAGLLNSTIKLIEGFTNFGLGTSAVKNVAEANTTNNKNRIGLIVRVVRRLVWLTGILGALITLIFSSTLSQITFGNEQYTIAFIWLSITLLINQLTEGEYVVLRGSRKLNYLAKASLTGSLLGLIFSLPIYYIWGIDGIVPAIIITSVINFLRTWYFSSKVHVEKVQLDYKTTIKEGNEMLLMGIMLSLSGIIKLGASYALRIFISHKGGVEHVGLYTAGFAIVETYVGMIFTAMATDYYPRLSVVNQDIKKVKQAVTQQASIAILLLAPIIVAFIAFIPI